MCRKKKVIQEEYIPVQPEPPKEEFHLKKVADPVFDKDGKRDYFTEYYNIYKNDYIDQYLNYYNLKKAQEGQKISSIDDLDLDSVRLNNSINKEEDK
ncbi:MAG: hypothetical protein K5765_01400 [Clostridia bacterium]|nr:hypothetical protein [Clostridia bacterium]